MINGGDNFACWANIFQLSLPFERGKDHDDGDIAIQSLHEHTAHKHPLAVGCPTASVLQKLRSTHGRAMSTLQR